MSTTERSVSGALHALVDGPAPPVDFAAVARRARRHRRRARVATAALTAGLAGLGVAFAQTIPGRNQSVQVVTPVTGSPSTLGTSATTAAPAPTSTPPGTGGTTTSTSGPTVQFAGVSFVLPPGWILSTDMRAGKACAQPAGPPTGAPSWLGCAGVWVEPWTTDPAQASGGTGPGSVWYFSTGVLDCPYPGSQPQDHVLTPGTLADQADRTVGGLTYRWYEWSAACSSATGGPVSHRFDPQVWWLTTPGAAFVDVTGHPETATILASVHPTAAVHTSGADLTAGPYGFLVPTGWRTDLPLTSAGGPASWAKFTDPASSGALLYKVSGGELAQAYLPNHAPNPAGVLGAPSPGPVAYLAPCTVTGQAAPATNVVTYTCATTTTDTVTRGVIVVGPYPQGYKVLQVTLPASQSATMQAILDSLPRSG